jgi:hypothetical protein
MKKKLTKDPRYTQGTFNPLNVSKYKGSWPIIYRSKLELNVFRWLDSNSKVITWGSESVVIPYYSPLDNSYNKKLHRYFVDLVVHLIDSQNVSHKLLIEIKPHKYTIKPTITPNKSQRTIIYEQSQYLINQAKWEAAHKWCEKNGYKFLIFTEKHIKE